MKIKKHQLFLWIGLAFLVLSCLVLIMEIIAAYREYDVPPEDQFLGFGFEIFCYLCFTVPVLFLEGSLIVSIYKMLKYKPHGAVMVCLLIAAILSASAIVFQILTLCGVLDFVGDTGTVKILEFVLFITGWPIVILSFVLSSIHKRRLESEARTEEADNQ